ncbi:zinc finger protein 316-like [Chiloscyllium plagiosum]|uniref:zinc finger protein 316-like n=1 Tax=Chiloscyllium plagiosum TaxID=36176 RepID=UPI001CB84EAD|nr:zinc finger protein 316-like [Chiloscyllium plagiosum]
MGGARNPPSIPTLLPSGESVPMEQGREITAAQEASVEREREQTSISVLDDPSSKLARSLHCIAAATHQEAPSPSTSMAVRLPVAPRAGESPLSSSRAGGAQTQVAGRVWSMRGAGAGGGSLGWKTNERNEESVRLGPVSLFSLHRGCLTCCDFYCFFCFQDKDTFPPPPPTPNWVTFSELRIDLSFVRSAKLQRHGEVPARQKPWKCGDCGKGFNYPLGTGDSPPQPHRGAAVCGKGFTQSSSLYTHRRVHTGEQPFACPECGQGFKAFSTLRAHRRVHSNKRPFTCPDCGKSFNSRKDLLNHQRALTGERPFACAVRGKGFACSSPLLTRQLAHATERPFPRPQCAKRFKMREGPARAPVHAHRGAALRLLRVRAGVGGPAGPAGPPAGGPPGSGRTPPASPRTDWSSPTRGPTAAPSARSGSKAGRTC